TVVLKLVNIVKPHFMYMGDKDYQQQSILRIMLKDLNLDTTIVGCPIVREQDGLAKSSRNVYLDPNNRQIALCLYRALIQAQKEVRSGILVAETLAEHAAALIESTGARVDYVKIIDSRDLNFPNEVNEHSRMVIAAYVGKTRLIDNMLLVSP
ncbi:MAG TPA: pantoate--beta-alanine ligase, partial [Candidatus Cloacimonadota bacterium]|nr:pantoate--beta-alanine ligase [Candidatus Cloacimonadota bacterium]